MKIICIGRNYEDHVTELQNERPDSPVIFIKPDSSIILKNQPFFIPDYSNEINYESEVILKICKLGKSIENKFAKKYYDQVGLGIDFTARDLQFELKSKGLPWEKAKAFDGSALIGNWINKTEFKNWANNNIVLLELDYPRRVAQTEEIKKQNTKDLLRSNTDELINRGGFGSPTIFINGDDMYFGNDRMELVRKKIIEETNENE